MTISFVFDCWKFCPNHSGILVKAHWSGQAQDIEIPASSRQKSPRQRGLPLHKSLYKYQ